MTSGGNNFNDLPEIVPTREIITNIQRRFVFFSSVAWAYFLNWPNAAASIAPTSIRHCTWMNWTDLSRSTQLHDAFIGPQLYFRLIECRKTRSVSARFVLHMVIYSNAAVRAGVCQLQFPIWSSVQTFIAVWSLFSFEVSVKTCCMNPPLLLTDLSLGYYNLVTISKAHASYAMQCCFC